MPAIRKSRLVNRERIATLLSRSCFNVGDQHTGDDILYYSQMYKKKRKNGTYDSFNKTNIVRIKYMQYETMGKSRILPL